MPSYFKTTMAHHLFKNFLEDKNVYILNISYWQKTVTKILAESHRQNTPFKEYLNTSFANGTQFLDGNPIFNAVFEKPNKAIRIIQEEPESNEVVIAAWLDQVEKENKTTIPELVIALELSKESQKIADYFIEAWIAENVDVEKMQRLIDQTIDKETSQYTDTTVRFAICTRNDNCEDLQSLKIYQILPDESAKKGYIRVIDESGEDDLYPDNCFIPLDLPQTIEQTLLAVSHSNLIKRQQHRVSVCG